MRNLVKLLCITAFLFIGIKLSAQTLEFTLRYNEVDDQYEVYGLPDGSNTFYFVGGGSQLSLVLPSSIPDVPLNITTVNGGLWTDNSRIYAPAVDPAHDFHAIASNGSPINLVAGQEILLYTFKLTTPGCIDGLRLFENTSDPQSTDAGMNGGDFNNFFPDLLTFVDGYTGNYDNSGMYCNTPPVITYAPDTTFQELDTTFVMDVITNDDNSMEGDSSLTYELLGIDSALFTIDSITGQIAFINTPDFENPIDADSNNVYSIEVVVCDDGAPMLCDTQAVAITVANDFSDDGIRLLCVNPITDQVIIKNFGANTRDISTLRLCSKFSYTNSGIAADMNIINGSLTLAPGDSVVLDGFSLDDIAADLGLYTPTGAFSDTAAILDFTQWGSGGNGRESVAVAKGIWGAGDFMVYGPDYCYDGDGLTENGLQFWEQVNPPLAIIDRAVTGENVDVVIDVQLNDLDFGTDSLVTTIIGSTTQGINPTVLNGDSISYTPPTNFIGVDTITYQICFAQNPSICDTTIILVTVSPDSDMDGISDVVDIDDDNDGIPDLEECPFVEVTFVLNQSISDSTALVYEAMVHGQMETVIITASTNPQSNLDKDNNVSPTGVKLSSSLIQPIAMKDDSLFESALTFTPSLPLQSIRLEALSDFDRQTGNFPTDAIGFTEQGFWTIVMGDLASYDPATGEVITNNPNGDAVSLSSTDDSAFEMVQKGVLSPVLTRGTLGETFNGEVIFTTYTPFSSIELIVEDLSLSGLRELIDNTSIVASLTVGIPLCDIDGDNIPNYLDKDSDGDGCSDAQEAGHFLPIQADSTIAGDYGTNGLSDLVETNVDSDTLNYTILTDTSNNYQFLDSLKKEGCNEPPIANNDTVFVNVNTSITIDPLLNDFDSNNDSLTITTLGNSSQGVTPTVLNNDSISYIPPTDFVGKDTIQYEICDDALIPLCDTAIIIINVQADNDGDGTPDELDLDDDNDGILDWDECSSIRTRFTYNNSLSDNTKLVYTATINGNLETVTITPSTNPQSLLNPAGIPESNGTTLTPNGGNGIINMRDDTTMEAAITFTTSLPIIYIEFEDLDDMDRKLGDLPSDAFGFTTTGYWDIIEGDLASYDAGTGNLVIDNPNGDATPNLSDIGDSGFEMLNKGAISGVLTRGTVGETNNGRANFVASAPFTSTDMLTEDLSLNGTREFVTSNFILQFITVGVADCDADGDGIPNFFDKDSDGDGCPDALEAGHGLMMQADSTIAGPYGNNGVADTIETSDTQTAFANYTLAQIATDSFDFLLNTVKRGCEEICGNGMDDDGDGFADCADTDCMPVQLAELDTITTTNYCLDLPLSDASFYTILLDGNTYNPGSSGCNFDQRQGYSTFDFTLNSPPHVLDWVYNGTTYSTTVNTVQELVDWMNGIDTDAMWRSDVLPNAIAYTQSNNPDTYGPITVTRSGGNAVININSVFIPFGTVIDLVTVDSHQIIITNNNSGCSDTINLVTVNQAPIAINDTIATPQNTAITIDLQNNDSDPDNDTLITTIIGTSTAGVNPTVLNNDSIDYTPPTDFVGNDTITYQICDNGTPQMCDTAMVFITIQTDNDGDGIPDALDLDDDNDGILDSIEQLNCVVQSINIDPNTLISSATDINAFPQTYTNVNGINGLDLTIDFTGSQISNSPLLRADGQFLNEMTINNSTTNTFTYSFTGAVKPIEVVFDSENNLYSRRNANSSVLINEQATINVVNVGSVTSTNIVNPNNCGATSFSSLNADGAGTSSHNYAMALPPQPSSGTANRNSCGFISTFTDSMGISSASLTYNYLNGRTNTATTSLQNFSLSIKVCLADTDNDGITNQFDLDSDGDGCPDASEAGHEQMVQIDSTIAGPFGANGLANSVENSDTDTATINYTIIGDGLMYEFTDNTLQSGCNSPPMAMNDTLEITKNQMAIIPVQINDSDIDGNDLTTTIIGTSTAGVNPTVLNNDSLDYSPPTDFVGVDTITYQICDNGTPQMCDTAMVFLTIQADNDGDGVPDAIDLDDDNDGILDADEGLSCITGLSHGSAAPNGNVTGWFINEPTPGYVVPTLGANSVSTSATDLDFTGSTLSPTYEGNNWVVLSGITATNLTDSKTNNQYIQATLTTKDNITDAAITGVEYYRTLNSAGDAFEFVWSISTDGGSTFTDIATQTQQTSDTGGNFPSDVSTTTANYILSENTTYTIRWYFYNASNNDAYIDGLNIISDYCQLEDTDNDGIANQFDLDSDGDGCPDIFESGVATNPAIDTISGPYGQNGFADTIENSDTDTANYTGVYNLMPVVDSLINNCPQPCTDLTLTADNCDYDGDGVNNVDDIDDDNDGILDLVENCANATFTPVNNTIFTETFEGGYGNSLPSGVEIIGQDVALFNENPDPNNNPAFGETNTSGGQFGSPTDNGSNRNCSFGEEQCEASLVTYPFNFSCGGATGTLDGNQGLFYNACFDEANIDADGDGIEGELICYRLHLEAGSYEFTANFLNIYSGNDYDITVNFVNPATGVIEASSTTNANGSTTGTPLAATVTNLVACQDAIYDVCIVSSLNDTGSDVIFDNLQLVQTSEMTDSDEDGDGILNRFDLDSDGDGCSDAYEAGHDQLVQVDSTITGPYGENGLAASVENSDSSTTTINYIITETGGIYEFLDSTLQSGCNSPPMAVNDTLEIAENQNTIIPVQLNDTDIDGDDLTTTVIGTSAAGATPTVLNGDSLDYTPPTDFVGIDTITYQICDNGTPVLCDTAMVLIGILPDNDGDGIPNTRDLDDDNDGIPDTDEFGTGCEKVIFFEGFEGGYGQELPAGMTVTGQDLALFNMPNGTGGQLGSPLDNGLNDFCADGEEQCEATLVNYPFNFSCLPFNPSGGAGNVSMTGNSGFFFNGCRDNSVANVDADNDGRLGEIICFNNFEIDAATDYKFSYDFVNIFPGDAQDPTYTIFVDLYDNNGNFISTNTNQVNNLTVGTILHAEILVSVAQAGNYNICFRTDQGNNGIDVVLDNITLCTADSDGDGIINIYDLDSDGDGCPDANEAGHGQLVQADSTIAGPYGENGLAASVENSDSDTASINYTINETNAGTADFVNSSVENGCDQVTTLMLKVMLQGAMLGNSDGLMRDDLRSQNFIPLAQPYTQAFDRNERFNHLGGGTETTTTIILNADAGTPDAIVDWIFVELRDPSDSTTVFQTISALVQKDGDVVDAATGEPLILMNPPLSFFVSVKHRNHLGAMKNSPVMTVNDTATIDFTTMALSEFYTKPGYENLAVTTESGKRALWAGNSSKDFKSKYDGAANDRIFIGNDVLTDVVNTSLTLNYANTLGYYQGDVNMDGRAKYDGGANDRIILQNIILTYPLNFNDLMINNYNNMIEQLP